jgi:hypothetical protein
MKIQLFTTDNFKVSINIKKEELASFVVEQEDASGNLTIYTEETECANVEELFYSLMNSLNTALFNYIQSLRDKLDERVDIQEAMLDLGYAIQSTKLGLDSIQAAKDDIEKSV